MKTRFHITLNPEKLVEVLLDTGVTAWEGSYITKIELVNSDPDDIWGAEVLVQLEEETKTSGYWVPIHKMIEAFNQFVHKMSFTVTNGELEDLDLDAEVADEICQTAVFGEVIYG